ncbi:YciI family protein [Rhizobium sp. BK251]|uniref:YciI family protein n=1 Tax=Rhizobium sp. BK251 TaxID=2512125 RepID=UPI00104E76E4|nr:YciI family protein [Rhizobium sp. BK251]TCL71379.1 hypothetical protein EV286_106355 [Rhizobium sp. BK251]
MLAIRRSLSAPGSAEARARYLEDHKAYLRLGKVKVLQSGPIFNEEGDQVGGVVIAEVTDLAEMREFSLDDPFVVHGIYGSTEIFEWRAAIDNRP